MLDSAYLPDRLADFRASRCPCRVEDAGTLAATAAYIAPLARDEWTRHHDDVLWDPGEAKRRAKEEDEKRNKEALAAKFAHIKDDPGKEAVEL